MIDGSLKIPTVQYKITGTLTPSHHMSGSANKQFVKIIGTRGETVEENCDGNFNVAVGSHVTCQLNSRLYVGDVTCIDWRSEGGDDGLLLSQVCDLNLSLNQEDIVYYTTILTRV